MNDWPKLPAAVIGGASVDLRWFDEAVVEIMSATTHPQQKPLAVVSANLDHVMHFGTGSRWGGTLNLADSVDWLTLLDGAPLRAKATQMTGQQWPRLAGSDLINPLLDEAESTGLSVGFLGGTEQTHLLLKEQFARSRPQLQVSGWWSPDRTALSDPIGSGQLANEIARSGTDMLVVGLGKPRQELWIAEYGARTGAPVLLAFGAVVDFLAGRIRRAPQPVVDAGMEWAWRLALEPKRLAQRYLVQGPEAYLRMALHSSIPSPSKETRPAASPIEVAVPSNGHHPRQTSSSAAEIRIAELPSEPLLQGLEPTPAAMVPAGQFVLRDQLADVTVVVVTYNNVTDIDALMAGLRSETAAQSLKVVVADNSSRDGTVERIAAHPDAILVETDGNLGYAGGINAALRNAGPHADVLVLNPDLRIQPGAIRTLRERLRTSSAGIVVPRLLDNDGTTYTSLRREPGLMKSVGDAVLGSKLSSRPDWLSEIDYNAESYQYPHRIEWATGAALLISGQVVEELASWDEQYFLYSEETDYFRRARDNGHEIWFEPSAVMTHCRGGSGASSDLAALMAVNRVRYAQTHHSRGYASLVQTIGAVGELARAYKPENRRAFLTLAGVRPWNRLPQAVPAPVKAELANHSPEVAEAFPSGAVIIPAHNEESVIGRTLRPLAVLAATGAIEVIVACNGCTDATATIAAGFPGVKVIDVPTPSKTAAMNAADAVCSSWPRLYLDADIEMTADAVNQVFVHLSKPGALAARPAYQYETSGATWLVRAYYRARQRIPKMNEHLWGAGAYALSEAGHSRFSHFPNATADDAYVDSLFEPEEKIMLPTEPVVVKVPLHTRELHKTLRRVYQGNHQLNTSIRSTSGLANVVQSVNSPGAFIDAGIYATLAFSGKIYKGKSLAVSGGWDRDESSRTA